MMARNFKDLYIFLEFFFKSNVMEIVHKMSTLHILVSVIHIMDIVNHSAGQITSYHMLDVVVRGMLTPPTEVSFTDTNTISSVLCISDTLG